MRIASSSSIQIICLLVDFWFGASLPRPYTMQEPNTHIVRLSFFLSLPPQAGDFLFRQMMDLTLREDKEIIENIYPEYQHGFMNARYDQQVRRRPQPQIFAAAGQG